jgi:hypothetical protein
VIQKKSDTFSGSGRSQKLSKKFPRIYEFFENPENNFRITRRSFRIRKISKSLYF